MKGLLGGVLALLAFAFLGGQKRETVVGEAFPGRGAPPRRLDSVRDVQRRINELGGNVNEDGIVGPKTCAAAIDFSGDDPSLLAWAIANCPEPDQQVRARVGVCQSLPPEAPDNVVSQCNQAVNSRDPGLLRGTASMLEGQGFSRTGELLRRTATEIELGRG